MSTNQSHLSRFDKGLGDSETRTEPYLKYGVGALELATTFYAKNTGRVGGFADKQIGVAGRCGEK